MSDRLAILLEKLTDNMELNLGGLRDQLRAELAALKAGQGEAVAPYGYLREVDGNVQLSIGALRPADRSGGIATPWAAIFAEPPATADAVSVPRELLHRLCPKMDARHWHQWNASEAYQAACELRALLAQSQEVKP